MGMSCRTSRQPWAAAIVRLGGLEWEDHGRFRCGFRPDKRPHTYTDPNHDVILHDYCDTDGARAVLIPSRDARTDCHGGTKFWVPPREQADRLRQLARYLVAAADWLQEVDTVFPWERTDEASVLPVQRGGDDQVVGASRAAGL